MKLLLFLLLVCTLKALSQDTSDWLSIDCGSASSYKDINGIRWETDSEYIQTGSNKQVPPSEIVLWDQMNSLRVFTQQNKNCYTLPTTENTRYFIRSMFKYGNYDGLNKPPTFDLEIDGNRLTTIETSLTKIMYYEVMYTSKKENISVCLDRTEDNQYPFITTLELWPLPDTMYTGMSRDLAWLMSYRYNYGADDTIIGYPDDKYNRIWEPYSPPGLVNVTANITSLDYTSYEHPPVSAILDAVEALSSTDSISLTFLTDGLNFVEISYTEIELLVNETRSFDIYFGNKFVYRDSPEYGNCTGVKGGVQVQGSLTVELRPTNESTLPPVISAIEVYTASDPLVTVGTSQDDVYGLQSLINAFDVLNGWSGEPCLPVNAVWQWLKCTGNDPIRVTTINLSGYGLNGTLPDFSRMQALESIDLSNNSLDGLIPEFLGNLPNLKLLDLRNNNFSGDIPYSIKNNKKLKYTTDGNSHHEGNKLGLIIGLAVGLPISIILFVFALIYFLKKRQTPPTAETNDQGENGSSVQGKPQPSGITVPNLDENHNPTVQEEEEEDSFGTADLNSVSQVLPSPANINAAIEEGFEDSVRPGVSDQQTNMVPEMDMDELDELLQQQDNVGPVGHTGTPSSTS